MTEDEGRRLGLEERKEREKARWFNQVEAEEEQGMDDGVENAGNTDEKDQIKTVQKSQQPKSNVSAVKSPTALEQKVAKARAARSCLPPPRDPVVVLVEFSRSRADAISEEVFNEVRLRSMH